MTLIEEATLPSSSTHYRLRPWSNKAFGFGQQPITKRNGATHAHIHGRVKVCATLLELGINVKGYNELLAIVQKALAIDIASLE